MLPFSKPTPFNLPEGYHEVTLQQFIHLHQQERGDVLALLEALTGVPRATWMNVSAADYETKLLPQLEWMATIPDFKSLPVPKIVTISGAEIQVPTQLNELTWGQKLQFELCLSQAWDEQGNIRYTMIPDAIAVYLADSKPYTDEKYEQMKTDVMQLPITIAYPVASFFLTGFLSCYRTNRNTYHENKSQRS